MLGKLLRPLWIVLVVCSVPTVGARAEIGLESRPEAVPRMASLRLEGPARPEDVAAGRHGVFRAETGPRIALRGGPGVRYWLRIELPTVAPSDEEHPPLHLRLGRDVPGLAVLHRPGVRGAWTEHGHDGFRPDSESGPVITGTSFRIERTGNGPTRVLLEVRADIDLSLEPMLLDPTEDERTRRFAMVLSTAVYTGLLLLALNAFLMYAALRERGHLCYLMFALSALLLLLAINGQLYLLPILNWLSWWEVLGVLALSNLLIAALFVVFRDFADLGERAPRTHRSLMFMPWPFVALAVIGLFSPLNHAQRVHQVSALAWVAGCVVLLAVAVLAVRHRRPLARPLLLVWLLIATFALVRALPALGLPAPATLVMHWLQVALAFAAFLLSVALADRVMQFRLQRDRARLAKAQTDASLHLEQARRQFVDALHSGLRAAPPGDLEWVAFRRLLEALRPLVPQNGSAVMAFDYHDLDLLLTEPLAAKAHYSKLIAERGGAIKGLCRSRKPTQLRLSQAGKPNGDGAVFALIPVPVPKPGWGAVLIERQPWESFEQAELDMVSEFAHIACAAADEAAANMDLKRKAELDPLTGALNRRALDLRLAREIERAHDEREPLSLLYMDLDHFKQVNDRHGHAVGDDCLRRLAEVVRREVGVEHVFGRYGGEEFVLLLPNQPTDKARATGERIRNALMLERIDAGDATVRLTVSIGIASRLPDERLSRQILERADKALYAAKHGGRNQVQVAATYAPPLTVGGPPYF